MGISTTRGRRATHRGSSGWGDAGPVSDIERAVQAGSFGAAAAAYQRSRPSYPAAAVDWLLPSGARRVVDLGAGTGQLTRVLVDRGLDVTAVEPSAQMRTELTRTLPRVRCLEGAAEAIPLPDASVDAVLLAQAWHWVDVPRASAEVARVLHPGGRLGLVWNIRDESVDWVATLGRLLHGGTDQDMGSDAPAVGAAFGPVERFDVAWTHTLTPAGLLDLVASRSYVITLPAADRADLLTKVQQLLDTHPALAGHQSVQLPYLTRCSRAVKAGR
jgi:SAM-dependent methyltransferase